MNAAPEASPSIATQSRSPIEEGLDIEPYRLRSPLEIAYCLNELAHHGDLLSVYFNRGRDQMLTTLVHADTAHNTLVFDWGGSETMNHRLLESERSVLVAIQNGIKIQFTVGKAQASVYGGRKAFLVALPSDLIKLQRREFFRVETSVAKPLLCLIPNQNAKALELPVHDLSLGGVGLWLTEEQQGFQLLDQYPACRIALGEFGVLRSTLEVRHRQAPQPYGARHMRRIGCRFLDLAASMQAQLQRYLILLQRERNALLGH